jgi:hypothetical protein
MTTFTKSKFYYGHTVTIDNRTVDFSRDSVVYQGQVAIGSYTLTTFAQAFARAMNTADPANNYVASVNRSTREITIEGDASFELLPETGVSQTISAFPLAGFTVDTSGANSYTGTASGSVFEPQLRIQDYTPFELDQRAADSVINESASGRVESVSFGRNKFMTCNIRFQNNKGAGFTGPIRNGIIELKEFLIYATTKADLEFMENIDAPETFTSCILESTVASSNGTGFRLTESNNLPGFYDSGRLVFRERT